MLFRGRATEGSVKLWLQVLGDLAFHAPKEHWSTLKEDLRYALRTLRSAPTFAARSSRCMSPTKPAASSDVRARTVVGGRSHCVNGR